MAADPPMKILLPLKLHAFVFNKPVFDAEYDEKNPNKSRHKAKIAPIAQPNYSYLRLDSEYIQNDILNHVDLHSAWPAAYNTRFTDIGLNLERKKRQGVYVHWTIPRLYRSGVAATSPESAPGKAAKNDLSTPDFPCVPTRWLVLRYISSKGSVMPQTAWDQGLEQVTGWVIESDRRWNLEDIPEDADLQVDVSPFILAKDEGVRLQKQAEIFIGRKTKASEWQEDTTAPRIPDFKLMTSSNQLFADYQPHCSNVFSMVDNFEYGSDNNVLTKATASYYVVGWHAKDDSGKTDDPFFKKKHHQELLDSMRARIKGAVANPENDIHKAFKDWLAGDHKSLSLCHGTVYDVKWDVDEKPPTVPADAHCKTLNTVLPVAVGTTPTDALMAYARAHENLDDSLPANLEKLILALEKQLLARDDGVEAQQQARDLLYNWNYLRANGGKRFFVAGNDGAAAAKPENLDKLLRLNKEQQLLDAYERSIKRLRWGLFSGWWKDVTDSQPSNSRREAIKNEVEAVSRKLRKLLDKHDETEKRIAALVETNFEPGTLPAFYQQRDPTLLVGGVQSGWEHDYLKRLDIRLDPQVPAESLNVPDFDDKSSVWQKFMSVLTPRLPSDLAATMQSLFREFYALQPSRTQPTVTGIKQLPLFHDQKTQGKGVEGPWRDRWNDSQPWFPLFLEWEVEYFHIDHDLWKLEQRKMRNPGEPDKLSYGIDVNLKEKYKGQDLDSRTFSGRTLILPQPAFSLAAKIDQLFSDTPAGSLGDLLDSTKRKYLQDNLHELKFLSAPLDGFTAHLTTLLQGSHVNPILTRFNDTTKTVEYVALNDAQREKAGLTLDRMGDIALETDQTPYWTSEKASTHFSLFKPVSHGQFRFLKLNIIDKFGQAIHAIDPAPSVDRQKLSPCISDWYAPGHLPAPREDIPNVIDRDESSTDCEFIQLPPQLNQQVRLNSMFVTPYSWNNPIGGLTAEPPWRPVTEWENPIWGWVVINYADFGIQLFLPNGSFYREVRLRSSDSEEPLESPEWLPFAPPKNADKESSPELRQLKLLVAKLSNKTYLREFVDMINRSTSSMEAAPDSYAEFRNALVGRPLALVNVGWSLELASEPFKSQADEKQKPAMALTSDSPDIGVYDFRFKMGDVQRGFDGLVAYFRSRASPSPGDALDLDAFYTEFDSPSKPAEDPLLPGFKHLKPAEHNVLQAFWIDPAGSDAQAYYNERNRHLHVFGVLMDPFCPLHTYSGILPVKELSLPPWTWQGAISSMKTFFHAGPLIVVDDVPKFNPSKELKPEDPVELPTKEKDKKTAVALPAMSSAEWAWLQPYHPEPPVAGAVDAELAENEPLERYMSLPISVEDEKARYVKQPYTAIEGYLQMAGEPPAKQTAT